MLGGIQKLIFFPSLIFSVLCFFVAVPLAASEDKEADSAGDFVVQFEVVSHLHQFDSRADYAYFSPRVEFIQFSKILSNCLETSERKSEFVIERFPAKFDPRFPEVCLYLNDWKCYREGEIRAVLSCRIKYRGESKTIGSFTGRSYLLPHAMQSLREKSFEEAMVEACEDLLKELRPMIEKWSESQEVEGV